MKLFAKQLFNFLGSVRLARKRVAAGAFSHQLASEKKILKQ